MFINMNMAKTQLAMLAFVSGSPAKAWHVRGLAEAMGVSVGAASIGLRELERKGLLSSERTGNMTFYRLLADKPSVKSFRLFLTLLELEPIVDALKRHSDRIVLFGSAATGEEREDSDIDLLVVTTERPTVRETLRGHPTVKGLPLNAVMLSPAELVGLSRKNKAFHDRAVRGVVLWRSDL